MSDIFISYKREEQPEARKLAEGLEGEGWTVWWDFKLRGGDDFDRVIEAALNESRCVIALWSKLSVKSDYVIAEAREAFEQKKLVPVAIEKVNLPFRFKGLHTLNLFNWDGSSESSEFRKLVDDITAIIGEPIRETNVARASRNRRQGKSQPLINIDNHGPGTGFRGTLKDQILIYESSGRDIRFDFQGIESQIWRGQGAEAKPVTPKGEGRLTFEPGGILTLERTNVEGRFEIRLIEYDYQGTRGRIVPKNCASKGDRKLWIHCEARVFGGKHNLMFVAKNPETEKWLAKEVRTLDSDKWNPIDLYLRVDPNLDFFLRIDDLEVSRAPSRVQIRDIRLVELT